MKNKIVIVMLILISSIVYAEEIKPKIGVKFTTVVDFKSVDGEVSKSPLGLFDDETYIKNALNLNAAFVINDVYTVIPWVEERFETRLNHDSEGTVAFRGRNRLHLGVKNKVKVKNIINFSFDAEYRMANDIKSFDSSIKDAVAVEHRVTPSLGLSGKYSTGISWSIYQMFPVYITKNAMSAYEFHGFYGASYNLLNEVESIDKTKYALNIYFQDMYVYTKFTGDVGINNPSTYNEAFLGFNAKIKDFKPCLAAALWNNEYINYNGDLYAGLKVGFSYQYKMLNFSLNYMGGANQAANADNSWNSYTSFACVVGI